LQGIGQVIHARKTLIKSRIRSGNMNVIELDEGIGSDDFTLYSVTANLIATIPVAGKKDNARRTEIALHDLRPIFRTFELARCYSCVPPNQTT
jgi:hypothetical protein